MDFNSTKVQFRDPDEFPVKAGERNFNSTKVQFRGKGYLKLKEESEDFNSTKVQFRAVKLDRKYHINKGFEKRFR